jgi:hypothetical protein
MAFYRDIILPRLLPIIASPWAEQRSHSAKDEEIHRFYDGPARRL